MIGHQAIGQDAQRHAGAGLAQQADEGVVIALVVEDLGPAVAAVDDVVTVAAHGGTGSAWHGAIIAPLPWSCKHKSRSQSGTAEASRVLTRAREGASLGEWVRRSGHRLQDMRMSPLSRA